MSNKEKLASLIDHTNLKSYATTRDIDLLCREAEGYHFATVCVYGYWIGYISETYPDLRITQVLNFPSGLSLSHLDTISQINSAASEYDIVMNLAKFKERHYEEVLEELKQVRSYVGKKPLKVIIESGVLDTEELIIATDLVAQSGADFIKTSTGFIPQSAEELIEQVAIIQNIIKLHKLNLEIKASGGVQTLDLAKVLIGLGATRLGTSHSTRIIKELEARG